MTGDPDPARRLSRRQFLRSAAGFGLLLAACPALAFSERSRSLSFRHMHTGEALKATYWENGRYDMDALREINRLLRDWRTGDVCVIDPGLLDQLHAIRHLTGASSPFEVYCGFRSRRTNHLLHARDERGVARNSLHLQGKAVDVKLADVDLPRMRDAAVALGAGGVGYYPRSGFLHLDTGRVRSWGKL